MNTLTVDEIHSELFRQILIDNSLESISLKVKDLKTFAERVDCALELMHKYKLLPVVKPSRKNDQLSREYRESGNENFKSGLNLDAFKLYSKSLAYAEPNGEMMALARGNRSAVLFRAGYFKECLEEIDLIKSEYSEKLSKKLEQRRDAAERSLKDTKTFRYHYDPPEEASNESLYVSPKVKLIKSPIYGRALITKEDLLPGEVVTVEDSVINVAGKDWLYNVCDFCARFTLTTLPCRGCTHIVYCSKTCMEQAWDRYHRYECEFFDYIFALELNLTARMSLRLCLVCNGMSDSFNLVTNHELYDVNDLAFHALCAAVLFYMLRQTSFFADEARVDACVKDMLLRHILTARANFHGISATLVPKVIQLREQCSVAHGVYPLACMFNHSCAPNVSRLYFDSKMVVFVTRPIKKGGQLFDNYGYHHGIDDKPKRQRALIDNFRFDCACEACVNDWPLFINSPITDPTKLNHVEAAFREAFLHIEDMDMQYARGNRARFREWVNAAEPFAPCDLYWRLQELFKESYFLESNRIHF